MVSPEKDVPLMLIISRMLTATTQREREKGTANGNLDKKNARGGTETGRQFRSLGVGSEWRLTVCKVGIFFFSLRPLLHLVLFFLDWCTAVVRPAGLPL